MARFLFNIHWEREAYNKVRGYLVKGETGKRISPYPDFTLMLKAVKKQRFWEVYNYKGVKEEYACSPSGHKLTYLSHAKEWCDSDQRRDNWTRS